MVWSQSFIKSESCSLEIFPCGTFALNKACIPYISSTWMGHHLINYCLDFTHRSSNKNWNKLSQLTYTFNVYTHFIRVIHDLPYKIVISSLKLNKSVRSGFRYSKDRNFDSKFLALKWVWCCDDRLSGSLPQFLRLSGVESLLLWCFWFHSWFICFFPTFSWISFKRPPSSGNSVNGWFPRVLSSAFFSYQSLYFLCEIASTAIALPSTQNRCLPDMALNQVPHAHIKLSP